MHDSNDKWVRRFTTDATSKHKNGFTIYKITSYLFPLASPEAVTVVTVWKRYSDLQKLQRNMKKMHQDLYLKGVCPSFTKWGYFRRFDQEAIDDRRKCTQALLEFIALHPPLFTSTEFVNFFQSSYSDPGADAQNNSSSNIEAIRSSLLLPVEVIGPLEYQSSEDDSFSTVDSPSVSTVEMTDSTHRKNSIQSATSRHSISTHPRSSLTNNETTGTVENVADILMLQDPIQTQTNSPMTATSPMSTSQISSTSENISDDRLAKTSSNKLNLPDLISFGNINKVNMEISQISTDSSTDSLSFLDSMSHTLNLTNDSKTILKNDRGETDLIVLRESNTDAASETDLTVSSSQSVASFFYDSQSESVTSKRTTRTVNKSEQDAVAKLHTSTHSDKMNGSKDTMDSASCISSTRSCSRMDSLSMDSIFGSSSDLKAESYVFEAGYLLSLGARHEAKGDYQKAFDFYKAGIEKMLIGAQDDTNDFRRQFVKDKTNKYLSYAEKIYANYLNNPESELTLNSMATSAISSLSRERAKSTIRHCDASSMCRPYEDLGKYRVLGIIGGQVMLVLCSETQQCYAMKVVQKTCNQVADEDYFIRPSIDNKLPIMPVEIPYMVKLIAYIETPNLLFLVLQYASGGKLFDYINNYVKSVPDTPVREVNLENVFIDPEEIQRISRKTSKDNSKICKDTVERIEFNKNLSENRLNAERNENNLNKSINLKKDCLNSEQKNSDNLEMSVTDIVINSQRLLLNVDNALSGRYLKDNECKEDAVNNVDKVKEISCSKSTLQEDRLSSMVSEVERTFDGLQEKLEQIIMEEDGSKFNIISNRSALPPKSLINWAAELLVAIDHLHQCGVICRNLNPNNLLLGERGHLMLSYIVGRDTQQALVTLLNEGKLLGDCYVAPELQRFPLLDESYDEKVGDFWSFGAVVYELIIGMPLSVAHPSGFNSHTILNMPRDLPHNAESLLSQLLCFDPRERLGSGPAGISEIKSHPYFNHVDWNMIEEDYKYDSK